VRPIDEVASNVPHWFSPGARRFFNSRVLGVRAEYRKGSLLRVTFVSSEKHQDDPRRYSVRSWVASDPTTIETIGDFQAYATARQADRAAQEYHRNAVVAWRDRPTTSCDAGWSE